MNPPDNAPDSYRGSEGPLSDDPPRVPGSTERAGQRPWNGGSSLGRRTIGLTRPEPCLSAGGEVRGAHGSRGQQPGEGCVQIQPAPNAETGKRLPRTLRAGIRVLPRREGCGSPHIGRPTAAAPPHGRRAAFDWSGPMALGARRSSGLDPPIREPPGWSGGVQPRRPVHRARCLPGA